jgi:hypothetical protein
MDWNITPIRAPLTNLRITLHRIHDLLAIMATRPLNATLHQLHVKMRDRAAYPSVYVFEINIAFCMSSLRTFIDALTSSPVMPILIDLIPTLTNEYHEEIAHIHDPLLVPHSSEIHQSTTDHSSHVRNSS